MKVLHIYKERPDELIKTLVEQQRHYAEIVEIRLYEKPVDYEKLIEAIEKTDSAFTW